MLLALSWVHFISTVNTLVRTRVKMGYVLSLRKPGLINYFSSFWVLYWWHRIYAHSIVVHYSLSLWLVSGK
ncbi:hypothetical protein BJY52DRAFT_1253999 [Lactarius psammicola]|nr:hypothetical protein BJY52DRAFT_1253999 [Lactarius psammicola]